MTIQRLATEFLTSEFLETLSNLSEVGKLTQDDMSRLFRKISQNPFHNIYIMVDGENGVVGTTTLLIEPKFLHGDSLVAHVEDVVVRKGFEGKGIGKSLVDHAIYIAKITGCYKVILNCHPENIPFYEKNGMRQNGEVCMRIDLK